MGAEIVLFSSEEPSTAPEVAAFLRNLADKVESGQVILRQGQDEVTMSLPHNIVLEVKAEEEMKRSGKKFSLEVELEWKEGDVTGESGPLELG